MTAATRYNKWTRRLQLLALFSLFFMYKVLDSVISNDISGMTFWGLFLIIYLITIIMALYLNKKSQPRARIE